MKVTNIKETGVWQVPPFSINGSETIRSFEPNEDEKFDYSYF